MHRAFDPSSSSSPILKKQKSLNNSQSRSSSSGHAYTPNSTYFGQPTHTSTAVKGNGVSKHNRPAQIPINSFVEQLGNMNLNSTINSTIHLCESPTDPSIEKEWADLELAESSGSRLAQLRKDFILLKVCENSIRPAELNRILYDPSSKQRFDLIFKLMKWVQPSSSYWFNDGHDEEVSQKKTLIPAKMRPPTSSAQPKKTISEKFLELAEMIGVTSEIEVIEGTTDFQEQEFFWMNLVNAAKSFLEPYVETEQSVLMGEFVTSCIMQQEYKPTEEAVSGFNVTSIEEMNKLFKIKENFYADNSKKIQEKIDQIQSESQAENTDNLSLEIDEKYIEAPQKFVESFRDIINRCKTLADPCGQNGHKAECPEFPDQFLKFSEQLLSIAEGLKTFQENNMRDTQ